MRGVDASNWACNALLEGGFYRLIATLRPNEPVFLDRGKGLSTLAFSAKVRYQSQKYHRNAHRFVVENRQIYVSPGICKSKLRMVLK